MTQRAPSVGQHVVVTFFLDFQRVSKQDMVGQLSGRVRKRAQMVLDTEHESRAARERALKRQRMYELMPRRKSGRLQVLDMKVRLHNCHARTRPCTHMYTYTHTRAHTCTRTGTHAHKPPRNARC